MPSIDVPGALLWYADLGSGEPILLVHGGLFDPMAGERFWLRPGVAEDLVASGRRVLVPDRRYSGGQTAADVARHTWDVEAADLSAILDAAEVQWAHIIAGSNGSSAALRLALREPARVRSLLLCWLAKSDASVLAAAFERSAAWLATHGPAAYVAELAGEGLPRPEHDRIGFPFGVALLNDARARASFVALSPSEAARVVRESGTALLGGTPIRGLTDGDAATLSRTDIPTGIVPTDPPDHWHTREGTEAVAAFLPWASVLGGVPPTPSPSFAEHRTTFARDAVAWLAQAEG
jgi:pimeloyl-ACP methyl ester carboxylesterase